jgi:membrane-bound ClpP family serine protease
LDIPGASTHWATVLAIIGEYMKNGRLIVAILTNLLDEALIVAIILWGLPRLGIHIPLYGIILICILFLTYAVIFYHKGSRALLKPPVLGFTDQVGLEGQVVSRLTPEGLVKISGELWKAKVENGNIEVGAQVVVVSQKGFKLIVRRRKQ